MNIRIAIGLALTVAGALSTAHAADASTERTTMPDYCSERDVTCVLPDGGAAVRSVPPASGSATGDNASNGVVTPPAATPGVPTGITNVPTGITGVPTGIRGVPSATGGTSGTTTSTTRSRPPSGPGAATRGAGTGATHGGTSRGSSSAGRGGH